MTKHYLTLFILLLSFSVFAQIPNGYYDNAEGYEGYALKSKLNAIITNGHNAQSYGDLYDGYENTDTDHYYENDGTVLDMYSENPAGSDPYNYNHGSNQCGSYSNEGDCYNREHIVPQSIFGSAAPMKSDIHHVVPSDGKVNGQRSNLPFGETDSPDWTSQNGSKRGSCSYPGYSGTVFEPIDEFKGDIARILFYFATRYETQIDSWSHAMFNGTEDQVFSDWFLSLILSWHKQDPVSQREIDRNNAAYNFQGNRNPFIDHPEWVECIWENNCNGQIAITSSPIETALLNQTYTYNITYTVNDENETLTCPTKPDWLYFTANTATNTGVLTGTPTSGDEGLHQVVLQLTENSTSTAQNFYIEVGSDLEVTIFNKDFEDQSISSGGWTTQSISGAQEWKVSTHSGYSGYYAKMSSWDGSNNNTNEDWLISPAVNSDDYTDEVLNFVTAMKEFGTDNTFTVYILTDYNGTDNPNTATLNDITSQANLSPGDYDFTPSGNIDLSTYTGTIYLAFKYTSGTNAGRTWEVEDIVLTGKAASGSNTLPTFTSTPITSAVLGQTYTYNITATDADGDNLTFSGIGLPTWLSLTDNNDNTATLSGTPQAENLGNNSLAVSVSDGTGNTVQSFTIEVTSDISTEKINNNDVKIYPNPASHSVHISTKSIIAQIEIKDILGKTVYSNKTVNTQNIKLNTANFAKGMYLTKITDNEANTKIQKLIIR